MTCYSMLILEDVDALLFKLTAVNVVSQLKRPNKQKQIVDCFS